MTGTRNAKDHAGTSLPVLGDDEGRVINVQPVELYYGLQPTAPTPRRQRRPHNEGGLGGLTTTPRPEWQPEEIFAEAYWLGAECLGCLESE